MRTRGILAISLTKCEVVLDGRPQRRQFVPMVLEPVPTGSRSSTIHIHNVRIGPCIRAIRNGHFQPGQWSSEFRRPRRGPRPHHWSTTRVRRSSRRSLSYMLIRIITGEIPTSSSGRSSARYGIPKSRRGRKTR